MAGRLRAKSAPTKAKSKVVLPPPLVDYAFVGPVRARCCAGGRSPCRISRTSRGTYKLVEVQDPLNDVSRQRVDQMVKAGKLLVLPGPSTAAPRASGGWYRCGRSTR